VRKVGIEMTKNTEREKILFYGTILTDAGSDEIEAADAKIYRDKYTDEYKKFKEEFDGTPYTIEYNRVCKKYEKKIKWLEDFVKGE
jgi:hypothetical protein